MLSLHKNTRAQKEKTVESREVYDGNKKSGALRTDPSAPVTGAHDSADAPPSPPTAGQQPCVMLNFNYY